VVGAVF